MTSYEIHFCTECNNLTSLSMNEENILIHDCKYCGKQEEFEGIQGKCIYSSFIMNKSSKGTVHLPTCMHWLVPIHCFFHPVLFSVTKLKFST